MPGVRLVRNSADPSTGLQSIILGLKTERFAARTDAMSNVKLPLDFSIVIFSTPPSGATRTPSVANRGPSSFHMLPSGKGMAGFTTSAAWLHSIGGVGTGVG